MREGREKERVPKGLSLTSMVGDDGRPTTADKNGELAVGQ